MGCGVSLADDEVAGSTPGGGGGGRSGSSGSGRGNNQVLSRWIPRAGGAAAKSFTDESYRVIQ